jgi:hypothetical protein
MEAWGKAQAAEGKVYRYFFEYNIKELVWVIHKDFMVCGCSTSYPSKFPLPKYTLYQPFIRYSKEFNFLLTIFGEVFLQYGIITAFFDYMEEKKYTYLPINCRNCMLGYCKQVSFKMISVNHKYIL